MWIKRTANVLNTDPGLNINITWNTMLLKSSNKEEIGCRTDPKIDEVPSKVSTPRAAVTAPSLDTN